MKAEHYENIAGIGKGKFGLVFLAKHIATGKHVAIKYIPKQAIFDSGHSSRFQQEISALAACTLHPINPFIMHYFGGYDTPTCIAIVASFAAGGELYHKLKQDVLFPAEVARFFFLELLSALRYLHEVKQLVYRDLKPENVLIDGEGHVCLCDFGFATSIDSQTGHSLDDKESNAGSVMYLAPEVASGFVARHNASAMAATIAPALDYWSLGCLLFETLTGNAPFGDTDTQNKFEIFNNITTAQVPYPLLPWKRLSSGARQVVAGLLDKQPSTRFSYRQVLACPWTCDSSSSSHGGSGGPITLEQVEQRRLPPPWIPPCKQPGQPEHFLHWEIALPSPLHPPPLAVQSSCHDIHFPVSHATAAAASAMNSHATAGSSSSNKQQQQPALSRSPSRQKSGIKTRQSSTEHLDHHHPLQAAAAGGGMMMIAGSAAGEQQQQDSSGGSSGKGQRGHEEGGDRVMPLRRLSSKQITAPPLLAAGGGLGSSKKGVGDLGRERSLVNMGGRTMSQRFVVPPD